ncbi:MAG: AAA family ATPase [Candidatus Moeniiplasma glomeromycotorum]|nr:AAA family ATPase [Candidatus Moeniiplasma glomeromycotorum]MCE8168178.1 AAA family ATPase [Candidatus Moeniiplasma glomeromycotorum]MCE8169991.1 AAA family ATPase [Candidatus Moeniiplasma glomeromycotorum]
MSEIKKSPKKNNNYYGESHWEKYYVYYLVFGSFFFLVLIILIVNSDNNSQIKKVNQRLEEQQKNQRKNPPSTPPPHNHFPRFSNDGYQSGEFVIPNEEQKNEKWLEETVFQESVREEFQIWVNSVKYLPRYRIGGLAEPERHALFYGPPGSGKSYLAEIFAINESQGYIFAKFGTETYSGSSQQKVNKVMAAARNSLEQNGSDKPIVIIIDEMDSVGVKNQMSGGSTQEVNAILTAIDDIKRDKLNIIIIGITNYPDVLDDAIKRAGRLGRQIKVSWLTKEEITKMVNYLEKDMKKPESGALKYEGNRPKWDKDKDKEVEWSSDFWSQVHQITQDSFEKCRQNGVGISYTDLELSIKDTVAKKVSKSSKKVSPDSADFKKELDKKVDDKIRGKKENPFRNPVPVPIPAPEREREDNN